jgi:hypothetical protein
LILGIIICDIFVFINSFKVLLMIHVLFNLVPEEDKDMINFPIKSYRVGVKNRVSRVTVNTHTFFWTLATCKLVKPLCVRRLWLKYRSGPLHFLSSGYTKYKTGQARTQFEHEDMNFSTANSLVLHCRTFARIIA